MDIFYLDIKKIVVATNYKIIKNHQAGANFLIFCLKIIFIN